MINEFGATMPIINDNFENVTIKENQLKNDEVISVLNGLIETCKDGQKGFTQAAEDVLSSSLKTTFYELGQQRAHFVGELQVLVRELGGDPENSGTISGALHRGWIDLKAVLTGFDETAVLNEVERSEDIAKANYENAIRENLPAYIMSSVQKQYAAVVESHNKIRLIRDAAKLVSKSAEMNR